MKNPFRFFLYLLFLYAQISASEESINALKLPPGFEISIYAAVPNAREMARGTKGTLFVGTLNEGKVFAIHPVTHKVLTIASDLPMPSGVAFFNGALYVAANHQILRFDQIEEHLDKPPKPQVLINTLPKERNHGWRYIQFGPDNKLYVGIGMPCNVCLQEDPLFGTIIRMNPDGTHLEIFAQGIRNTVGFDWDPNTHQLWFTENGRDWLGDDLPPDEINHAPVSGLHFGFPYIHGTQADNTYTPPNNLPFTPPKFELPAHVAPLGLIFYTGKQFPSEYHNQIFIAEHGSWNRSKKTGYQVLHIKQEHNRIISVKPFIQGWLKKNTVWGRPVGFLNMPDGSLLISDDLAGVIYQVRYHGQAQIRK